LHFIQQYSKADVEIPPLDASAYTIVEDIRYYRQLGGFRHERDKTIEEIWKTYDSISIQQLRGEIDWSAGRQGVVIHELFRFRF